MARRTAKLGFGPASRARRTARLWLDAASVTRRGARLELGPVPAARQTAVLAFGAMTPVRQTAVLAFGAMTPARQTAVLAFGATTPARQTAVLAFGAMTPARQTAVLAFGATTPVRQTATLAFGAMTPARQTAVLAFGATTPVRQTATLAFGALTPVRRAARLTFGPVPAARRCAMLIFGPTHESGPQTQAWIAGAEAHPIAIRVTESADQAVITATLEFAEPLPAGLGPPAPVRIEIMGIRYDLLGESYSRSREFGSRSWTLTAASPAYRLQGRYALTSGELGGPASAVARNLAGDIPVLWHMVDWNVRAGAMAADGTAPLELLRTLTGAAGGIITSDRAGNLCALTWPPHRPEEWAAHVETETDSLTAMITIQDDPDARELYNAVTVTDAAENDGLRIEEDSDKRTDTVSEALVYQVPWTDGFATRHCGDNLILLEDLGVEEREITDELIEIVDGAGRTQYPVYGVVASRWNKVDLGTITAEENGDITAEVAAESLLYLSYITRARRYRVDLRGTEPLPLMLVAEET